MAVRLTKPWVELALAANDLHGHLGVFQLADADDEIVYIGYAGGSSQFGLRAEIAAAAEQVPDAASVRWEINTAYLSRFRELMMVHIADHGSPPPANPPVKLGKLSPT